MTLTTHYEFTISFLICQVKNGGKEAGGRSPRFFPSGGFYIRKEERIKALKELLSKVEESRPLNHEDSVFIKWHDDANCKLREFYVDHPYVK
jgi:hypothetical protein